MTTPPNQTLAVALHYDHQGAPLVVAKGKGTIGAKIIARAFRDAEDRAAQEIAENIQTRMASFFYAGM